jgi:two-component system LytT family response regulator
MDRIIIIDDKVIRNELEAFLIANQEHIRLNSNMDEVSMGNNPSLQEIISLYENKYKLKIRSRDNIRFYRLKDIIRLEAKGKVTLLKLINGKLHTINESFEIVESQLRDFPFFKAHNEHLINLYHVTGIQKIQNARIFMDNGDVIPLLDKQKDLIVNALSKFIK